MPPSDPDHRLVKALDHPIRVGFLSLLAERETLSPREGLELLAAPTTPLRTVVYHVLVLHQFGLVAPAGGFHPDQGMPFRATPEGEMALAALGLSF
jgi:hypothetical protein